MDELKGFEVIDFGLGDLEKRSSLGLDQFQQLLPGEKSSPNFLNFGGFLVDHQGILDELGLVGPVLLLLEAFDSTLQLSVFGFESVDFFPENPFLFSCVHLLSQEFKLKPGPDS